MKYLYLSLLVMTLIFYGSKTVNAQISFPEFSLSSSSNQSDLLTIKPTNMMDEISFIKTPLFRDMLILQNQINLLERLIERQSELQSISLNYKRMGIPFKQPSPSRNICAQLPINVLCLLSYPDLKINQKIVQESKVRLEAKQRSEIIELLANLEQESSFDSGEEFGNINILQPREEKYLWSDIKCLNDKCSALLISNIDTSDRVRVKNNHKIDGKNITITRVTKSSVMALVEGKKIEILPLPIGGSVVETKPTATQEKIANILQRNLGDNVPGGVVTAQDEVSIPEIDLGGMLGPTGLF